MKFYISKKYQLSLMNILFFLNILLIGGDKLAFSVGGFNVRIVQFILIITTIFFILEQKYNLKNHLLFYPFLISNIISTYGSYDTKASIAYIMWTIFNYICIFCLFYSWSRKISIKKLLHIWRITFILQGIYIVIQFIIGLFGIEDIFFGTDIYKGIPRPAVWFYEPSYIATYFSIFFSIAIYMYLNTGKSEYKRDLILATIFIIFIASTTGYLSLVIATGMAFLFFSDLSFKEKISYIIKLIVIILILFSIVYMLYPKLFNVFIGRIFKHGISNVASARIKGWGVAFKVFKENIFLGVGPAAFQKYLGISHPPTNVTLEILATLGLSGFFTFLLFIGGVLFMSYKKIAKLNNHEGLIAKGLIFSFIIFWIVLQANQNYLRLYMWMHLGIISGVSSQLALNRGG